MLGKGGSVPPGRDALRFTPICQSPEQVRFLKESHSFNSDVWMIGCWFSQLSSLERTNCFQTRTNDLLKGSSDLGNDIILSMIGYNISIRKETQCREMPSEYGADYNGLIQWMLTYD